MRPNKKLLLKILIVLLVIGLVYIFALEEDRTTLKFIRDALRAFVRAF